MKIGGGDALLAYYNRKSSFISIELRGVDEWYEKTQILTKAKVKFAKKTGTYTRYLTKTYNSNGPRWGSEYAPKGWKPIKATVYYKWYN